MSGLKKVLPLTHIVMLIGCLALAGFPGVSGFFSKDEIVGAAMHHHPILGIVLLVTAFMTAYYTFRLYFRVFWGPLVVPEAPASAHGHGHEAHEEAATSHAATPSSGVDVGQTQHGHGHGDGHHNHEPMIMMLPLILLAIGAFAAGYLNWPAENFGHFLGNSPSLKGAFAAAFNAAPHTIGDYFGQEAGESAPSEILLMVISGLVSIAGIGLAYLLHLRDRSLADRLSQGAMRPLIALVENKFFVDETYQGLIVAPLRFLGKIDVFIDRFIVDGLVNLAGAIPQAFGFILKLFVQTGYLQGYAAAMLAGVGLILLLVFLPAYAWVAITFAVLVALLLVFSAVFKLGH